MIINSCNFRTVSLRTFENKTKRWHKIINKKQRIIIRESGDYYGLAFGGLAVKNGSV